MILEKHLMNDYLLNDSVARDKLEERIKEAEHERFVRQFVKAQRKNQPLNALRSFLVKTISTVAG
jgi:hypothetical protein